MFSGRTHQRGTELPQATPRVAGNLDSSPPAGSDRFGGPALPADEKEQGAGRWRAQSSGGPSSSCSGSSIGSIGTSLASALRSGASIFNGNPLRGRSMWSLRLGVGVFRSRDPGNRGGSGYLLDHHSRETRFLLVPHVPGPDRVGRVATLELNPYPGSDGRELELSLQPAGRQAGNRPS